MSKQKLVRAEDASCEEHFFAVRNGRPPRQDEVLAPDTQELADAGYRTSRPRGLGWREDDGQSAGDQVVERQLERARDELARLEQLFGSGGAVVGAGAGERLAELRERIAELEATRAKAETPRLSRAERLRQARKAFMGVRDE